MYDYRCVWCCTRLLALCVGGHICVLSWTVERHKPGPVLGGHMAAVFLIVPAIHGAEARANLLS